MRISLVHSRFNQFGGAERYALELARAYADDGHTVTILSTTPPPEGPWRYEELPIPRPAALWRHPSPVGKVYRHLADLGPYRARVARQIAATTPDVVHLHNWHHIGAGAIRSLPPGIPVLHTVHDFALADPTTTLESEHWSAPKTALLRLRGMALARQFRRVHLHWPSERTRRLLTAASPSVLKLRSSVVPLSVSSTVDLTPLAAEAPTPGTFLFLGHLSEHKGLADLLAAWAEVSPSLPGSRLVVAGDGPLRAQVEDDANVTYLGYIDAEAKRVALREAAWVLFPSRWHENFSITCVEALAAGRPIISSAIARPPMASDASLLVASSNDSDGDPAGLAAVLRQAAALTPADYHVHAASAAADGAALGWTDHVQAMIRLLDQVTCETADPGPSPGPPVRVRSTDGAPRVPEGQDVQPS